MSKPRDIVVIVGSIRHNSFSGMVAGALAEVAPEGLKLEQVPIAHLQLYNQDLDGDPPQSWQEFKARVRQADGVIFVTPEHNRSVPAALKNALDIASRPYGDNAWAAKPGLVVSQSPGQIGGFGANHHLRQSLAFLDVKAMAQPEIYLSHSAKLFDENGKLTSDSTRDFLAKSMVAFGDWVEANIGLRSED
jgi:chromate reductase, NAD(P)H dehydrogenase (quinone)